MYDRVLVPTDGSEAVQQAIDEAVEVASLTGADLHALSVVDVGDFGLVPHANVLTVEETLTTAAEEAVEEVRERGEAEGLSVETAVREGNPHQEILAYADENDVDLIVMGTHGRTDIDRVLLGSVTEQVVRNADQPVLVKRMRDEQR